MSSEKSRPEAGKSCSLEGWPSVHRKTRKRSALGLLGCVLQERLGAASLASSAAVTEEEGEDEDLPALHPMPSWGSPAWSSTSPVSLDVSGLASRAAYRAILCPNEAPREATQSEL